MSSVKRYWHKPGKGFAVLDPIYYQDESGFVAWEDYDALTAECQRLREAIESAESLFPLIIDAQKFWFDGREIKADGDDRFYSAKKVEDFLSGIRAALAGSKEGEQ